MNWELLYLKDEGNLIGEKERVAFGSFYDCKATLLGLLASDK